MAGSQFNRRHVLGALAATPLLSAMGACAPPTPPFTWPRTPGAGEPFPAGEAMPKTFRESPMLTQRVDAGDLPPLRERLPREPLVVRGGDLLESDHVELRQGNYGGTLQLAQETPTYDPHIFLGNVEPLIWAKAAFGFDQEVTGNVAAGFEVRNDDREFVFHLRPGMRWSDGEPVTTDGVRFAFEDVLLNEELTPVFPIYLQTGRSADGKPAELEIVDDHTFVLRFDEPYGSFVSQIAINSWISYSDVLKPRHYLEQFHQKYADKKRLAALMRDSSIPEGQWFNLFNAKQFNGGLSNFHGPQGMGHPTLTPWRLTEANNGVFIYERNPYYFKVDPNGHQLPYLDRLRSQTIQDKATSTARALMGEFDFAGERASLRQLPLIAAQRNRGEIRMLISRMHRLAISFFLNMTFEDKTFRLVTRDRTFRKALDVAINRQEILENFYLGQFAEQPKQITTSRFDQAAAKKLLDQMGMDKVGGSGYRLAPNGEEFRIGFEISDQSEDHVPMGQLIAEYWREIGVNTTVRMIEPSSLSERQETNTLQASAIWMHLDTWLNGSADDYLPTNQYGPLWTDWYVSNGERGDEPPAEIKRMYADHARYMRAISGTPESKAAMAAIIDNHRRNIWEFCPVENAYYPTFWSKRVHNVPEGEKEDVFGLVANMSMEQWYIDEDEGK